tara:strand:- start:2194 stop:2574 length:381 start_codon:yes stop_codon:yes gene_type:complete
MAYRLGQREALIEFEDLDLNDSELRCKLDVPLGTMLEIESLMSNNEVRAGFEKFAKEVLISWSFIDANNKDIPADEKGIMQLPFNIALKLVEGWLLAVQQIPLANSSPSQNGTMSEAESTMPVAGV